MGQRTPLFDLHLALGRENGRFWWLGHAVALRIAS